MLSKFLPNPWIIVALLILLGGATGLGFKLGNDHQIAKQADAKELIQAAADEFDTRAAKQIAKIKPIQQTIQGQLKETIRENTVYRDCVVDPATERLLDAARANREAPPAGGSLVPGAGNDQPQDVR